MLYDKCNKPVNVEVTLEECGGNSEKMIRRFLKKVYKSNLLKEVRAKGIFTKPSQIRHNKKRNAIAKLRNKTTR